MLDENKQPHSINFDFFKSNIVRIRCYVRYGQPAAREADLESQKYKNHTLKKKFNFFFFFLKKEFILIFFETLPAGHILGF